MQLDFTKEDSEEKVECIKFAKPLGPNEAGIENATETHHSIYAGYVGVIVSVGDADLGGEAVLILQKDWPVFQRAVNKLFDEHK